MVGRQSRMFDCGREAITDGGKAFLDSQEWSGVPPGGLVVVGRLSCGPAVVRRPSWRGPTGREALTDSREWSGDLPVGPGVVVCLTRRAENGREVLPEGREWSRGHLRRREWSDGPPGGTAVVWRPSWNSLKGREWSGRQLWSGG